MRWNPLRAPPPPPPESTSLLSRVQELSMPHVDGMRAMLGDFQDFIQQGNMIDLAVGLILGSSFSAILNSFVVDILSPIISLFSVFELVFKRNVVVKKQCPYCKEFIKGAATRCKDCGSDISSPPNADGG
ncbi:hypothetical protein BBJ28_00005428 [Nothophytophthora sp. Chile5]|nr:hypothetical protein BBJ28_00005428 [Nothophytophthora sp. Chile5]